mmetsp:Transcript_28053/g.80900  ORF Transcript_28053/g.80900 Transcript_28053/m.80900 type:complete len:225 (-) Transcript_28053:148-822(-)
MDARRSGRVRAALVAAHWCQGFGAGLLQRPQALGTVRAWLAGRIQQLVHAALGVVCGGHAHRGALLRRVGICRRPGYCVPPVPPTDKDVERVPQAHRAARGRRVILPPHVASVSIQDLDDHGGTARPPGGRGQLQAVEPPVVECEPVLTLNRKGPSAAVSRHHLRMAAPGSPADDLDCWEGRSQHHVVAADPWLFLHLRQRRLNIAAVAEGGSDVVLGEPHRKR